MDVLTPMKAIRAKCLDCSAGSSNEVKLCQVTNCPLFPYRFGKNPNLQKERTPAQLEALRNGRVAFESVDNSVHSPENPATEGKLYPRHKNRRKPTQRRIEKAPCISPPRLRCKEPNHPGGVRLLYQPDPLHVNKKLKGSFANGVKTGKDRKQ